MTRILSYGLNMIRSLNQSLADKKHIFVVKLLFILLFKTAIENKTCGISQERMKGFINTSLLIVSIVNISP